MAQWLPPNVRQALLRSSRSRTLAARAPRRHLFRLDGRSEQTLLCPQIDERLHGLNLLVANQAKQAPNIDEMDEACVELLVRAHVPEWLQPVSVVDMCVASHHLPVDRLDVPFEGFGEARRFAEPFATRELGQRCIEEEGEGLAGYCSLGLRSRRRRLKRLWQRYLWGRW